MPVGRGGLNQGKDVFARYPSLTYSTIPDGLMLALVSKQVGRNGWAVMVALCRKVYADGKLGRASAEEIARRSGLTRYQIARGMTELRDKNIIVPVVRKTADGFRKLDRSNYGHVAQYCITRDVWKLVSLDEGSRDASQQSS